MHIVLVSTDHFLVEKKMISIRIELNSDFFVCSFGIRTFFNL